MRYIDSNGASVKPGENAWMNKDRRTNGGFVCNYYEMKCNECCRESDEVPYNGECGELVFEE